MVWWLVGGLVLIGLVLLVAVCLPVLRRLDGLRRAAERAKQRAEEAQGLQAGAAVLAERLAGLEDAMARTQAGAAARHRPKDS